MFDRFWAVFGGFLVFLESLFFFFWFDVFLMWFWGGLLLFCVVFV